MNVHKLKITSGILVAILGVGCTDLEVKEKDSYLIESEGVFAGVPPDATLNSAYLDLRDWGNQENLYALSEVASDELLVPTRGVDWGDNGIWRSLRQHEWDDSHQYILNTWNNLNRNVYKLNQLLASESGADAQQTAEGKFLRAFNMWYVLDLYRQVPFRDVHDAVTADPRVFSVQEALDFIIKDLTEALPALPSTGPGGNTIKASKAAAHFLLAKIYLNKHIYLNTAAAASDMTQVITHVDAITADGFALNEDYFDTFKDASNPETILWTDAEWGNRIWNGLHYNQGVSTNTGGGWNGFSTTAEFYALFEGDPNNNEPGHDQEERRGYVQNYEDRVKEGIGYGFLIGQQYDSMGAPLKDRPGNPLIFTKDFASNTTLTGNNERNGIRVIKYHPSTGSYNRYYVLARYADAYLMKIEAILRGGTAGEDALTLYNALRSIRGASEAEGVTIDDILDERGRELYIEGWRRNDQVRFGTFTSPFPYMNNTDAFRNVYPIPANALTTNPNLQPTEGY
ncbi:RagB/SusD family nutrient uptake outer membrane protein [Dawidia soli]|uniref:RagB/SusD family nutrient uptake outer membrane protein n=1 Tax=Dawidia soli TaxID=2782352 RepID=A0AAP2GKG5_9BACT|nr:RagB/SusD family nutrient uptake outer membrane protein [Dawidia soli]MBT1689018.1 RagB/SusD family nutrient uptake outer membrane protein [Dawidia soli]